MVSKIGLNGFNVASKLIFRQMEETPNWQIAHVNCPFTPRQLADSLKEDATSEAGFSDIGYDEMHLSVNGRLIPVTNFNAPNLIPWSDSEVSVVLDSGLHGKTRSVLQGHLSQGVRRVLLCCPPADNSIEHVVMVEVNDFEIGETDTILSVASSEAACAVAMLKTLDDGFGIARALMHAVIPNSQTGAPDMSLAHSEAVRVVQQILPNMHGVFDGSTTLVSACDCAFMEITAELHQHTTAHDVRECFQRMGQRSSLLDFSSSAVEKSQILRNPCVALFDAPFTKVIAENFVQIAAWYDADFCQATQILKLLNHLKDLENC